MNPKISYVMITARDDHPVFGRPDLHLFDTTMHCLGNQSFKDFEWVIIDYRYESRKNYFVEHKPSFPVKHVPALPNIWLEHGLPGVCTQYNKGIIYADGDHLFFTGDSYMFKENFMEELWQAYLKGYFGLAWYMFDNTFSDGKSKTVGDKNVDEPPVPYNILGFHGGNQTGLEHRYVKLFGYGTHPGYYQIPWLWWFGCSSASREAMLKINGFNQLYDGDKMLMDTDVGSRLNLAGYGSNFAMFRNLFLIRPLLKHNTYQLTTYDKSVTIKCNHGLTWYSRARKQYRANSFLLTDEDVDWIKNVFCRKQCKMNRPRKEGELGFCEKKHPWQYPFQHKPGYPGHGSSKEWWNFWMKNQQLIDLAEERELRLDEDPKYQEGTFLDT